MATILFGEFIIDPDEIWRTMIDAALR